MDLRAAPSLVSVPTPPLGTVALFFAATGGGVQKVHVTLANAFAARGLAVACVLPQAKGPFLANLTSGVAVVDLGTRDPLRLLRRLARYLREQPPGALIAAQQHTILAAVWARRLAGASVPLAIVQHNALSELCRNSRRPALRWLVPPLTRLFYPWADEICAVSQGVARDLAAVAAMPEDRVRVIYNPVVAEDIDERASRPSGHLWLDAKDRPVFLGVGNLIEHKDFATLVRAFARARRRLPARLVILGEGQERGRLEQLARELGVAEDIDLPGFLPNPVSFMARADAFVLSSRVEGLPTVIVEALACGTPVVSTDCPYGPAELLEDGALGPLVPVGADAELADAMLATIQRSPDPERLKNRAADFRVDRAVEHYLDLLRALGSRVVAVR